MGKTFLLIFYFSAFCLAGFAQSWQWAARMGSPSPDPGSPRFDDFIRDMAVDPQGNVYVCGTLRPGADAGGMMLPSFGNHDIIVAKYNCNGSLVWIKTAGSSLDDESNGIAYDGLGHLYITGAIVAESTVPCNLFGDTITEQTGDMFLSKLDTAGNLIWNKIAHPGPGFTTSIGYKCRMDSSGNLDVFVFSYPGFLFAGDTIPVVADYIIKFDTTGLDIGRIKILEPPWGADWDFTRDLGSNYYLFFSFGGVDSIMVGNTWVTHLNPNINAKDFVLAKFNNAGVVQWIVHFTDSIGLLNTVRIKMDSNGSDFFIGGGITNGIVFGNDTMHNTIGAPNKFFPFIAKFNSQGQALWGANASTQYSSATTGGIAQLSNGDIVFSGKYGGNSQFGSSLLTCPLGADIFLARASANGNIVSATSINSPSTGNDQPTCIASDANDNIYIAGAFEGSMTVNGTTYTSAGGYSDAFVARYGVVNCVVGIDELDDAQVGLKIYPNPCSSQLTIHKMLSSGFQNAIRRIELYDLMGEKVLEKSCSSSSDEETIDVSHLSLGMYIVRVYFNNHDQTYKVIKE